MVETIAIYVSIRILDYALNKEMDGITEKLKPKLEQSLSALINKVIDKYTRTYPPTRIPEKIVFIDSKVFVDELLKYSLCEYGNQDFNWDEVQNKLKTIPNIIPPSVDEINNFLIIFSKNLSEATDLKNLFVKEYSQQEIFNISKKFTEIAPIIYDIKSDTKKILNAVTQPKRPNGKLPKELTPINRINIGDIIGRDEDLGKVRNSLLNNNKTLLLNGMGGIGKTTLAMVYVDTYYKEYNHIIWLTIEDCPNVIRYTNITQIIYQYLK